MTQWQIVRQIQESRGSVNYSKVNSKNKHVNNLGDLTERRRTQIPSTFQKLADIEMRPILKSYLNVDGSVNYSKVHTSKKNKFSGQLILTIQKLRLMQRSGRTVSNRRLND